MNIKLIWLLLLLPISLTAQVKKVKATIVNPGSLISTYDFTTDVGNLKDALKKSGGSSILADVVKYSQQENWPETLQTLDSRLGNADNIRKFTAYKIVSTSNYCILQIPANENKYMVAGMRPTVDIFLVMELDGASYEGNIVVQKEENYDDYDFPDFYDYEDEDSEDGALRAYIENPREIYSSFNLAENHYARDILLNEALLTEEEFQLVASKSKESGWPSGISTLSDRLDIQEKIKNYYTYYIMEFGDESEYTLLWIPKTGNEHMPSNMQPVDEEGFYMVLKSSAVTYDF